MITTAPPQEPLTHLITDEQQSLFMEVIDESLRMVNRSHLFNWLQRSFQCLIPHEVLIIGVRGVNSAIYEYEYITSTRYFGDQQFEQVLNDVDGLVSTGFQHWAKIKIPVFYGPDVSSSDYLNFSVVQIGEDAAADSELRHFVVHGFEDERNKVSTLVMFGRLGTSLNAPTAHLLKLLMPHLHCAIVKVTSNKSFNEHTSPVSVTKVRQLTTREQEVLHWLQLGKTNWEISTIINVSPMTVKNHVQNILRKLDVENRSQAVSKAIKLGLINRRQ